MDRDLRRLVLLGVALLLVLFVGRAVVGSMYDEAGVRRQLAQLNNRLRAGGEAQSKPDRTAMKRLAEQREELAGRLEAAVGAVNYTLPPEFDVGPGQSPDLRYFEVVRREQDALVKGAAYIGKSVPSNLGLPELNPTGLEDVLRSLRALHIVHEVVTAALEADVDAVDEIRVPVRGRRTRGEAGDLRTHRVEFELHGRAEAVRDALAGVVTGRPYLALDDVRIESRDEDGQKVDCRFTAVALVLDTEQAAAP